MANANVASGMNPVMMDGSPWSGQGMLVAFKSGDSNNIFIGDPLIPAGGVDPYGVPYVTIAVAGATNTVLGSFIGIHNGPAVGAMATSPVTRDLPVYRQASIANYGLMTTSRDQFYAMQEDGLGGAIAASTGGFANGNLIAGAGSTVTGFSGWLLDSSTVASGNATYQVKVCGLLRGPDNALGLAAKWLVQINLWSLANGTVGF